jgi:hypothetical protein
VSGSPSRPTDRWPKRSGPRCEQHHRTLTLLTEAKACGHARVAEMNQQVLTNLDRMIGELQADQTGQTDEGQAADAS